MRAVQVAQDIGDAALAQVIISRDEIRRRVDPAYQDDGVRVQPVLGTDLGHSPLSETAHNAETGKNHKQARIELHELRRFHVDGK